MNKFWTDKLDNLLRRHYPKGDIDALAQRLGVSKVAVKSRAYKLGLKRKVHVKHPWTECQLRILQEHYATMPMPWLEVKTRHQRDSIENKAHELGLHKTQEYKREMGRVAAQRPGAVANRFKKGQAPSNKGKRQADFMSAEGIERTKATRFQPGQRPHNTRPVGYERIDDDGYVLIKTDEGEKMVLKHRHIWRQHHGEIPRGMIVTFRDGDRTNCDIANLELISRAEAVRRNTARMTPEQRKARSDKAQQKRNKTIRMDKIRLHWGLEPRTRLVKRW